MAWILYQLMAQFPEAEDDELRRTRKDMASGIFDC
jgi:hypothetical protein